MKTYNQVCKYIYDRYRYDRDIINAVIDINKAANRINEHLVVDIDRSLLRVDLAGVTVSSTEGEYRATWAELEGYFK